MITHPHPVKTFGYFPHGNNAVLSAEISQPAHMPKVSNVQGRSLFALGAGTLVLIAGIKFLLSEKNKLSLFLNPDDFKVEVDKTLKPNSPLASAKAPSWSLFPNFKEMQPEPTTFNTEKESKKSLKYLGYETLAALGIASGAGLIHKLNVQETDPVAPVVNTEEPIDPTILTITDRSGQTVRQSTKTPGTVKAPSKGILKPERSPRKNSKRVGFFNNGIFAPDESVPSLPLFERKGKTQKYGPTQVRYRGRVFGTGQDVWFDHSIEQDLHRRLTGENNFNTEYTVWRPGKRKYEDYAIPYLESGLLDRSSIKPEDVIQIDKNEFNQLQLMRVKNVGNRGERWVQALAYFTRIGKL